MKHTGQKALTLLLTAWIAAGMLAGCGNASDAKETDTSGAAVTDTTATQKQTEKAETVPSLADTNWQMTDGGDIISFFADGNAVWTNPMGGERMDGVYVWENGKGSMTLEEDWSVNLEWENGFIHMFNEFRDHMLKRLEKLPDGYQLREAEPTVQEESLEGTLYMAGETRFLFLPGGKLRVMTSEDEYFGTYYFEAGSGTMEFDGEIYELRLETPQDLWITHEYDSECAGKMPEDVYAEAEKNAGELFDQDGRGPEEINVEPDVLEETVWLVGESQYAFMEDGIVHVTGPDTDYFANYVMGTDGFGLITFNEISIPVQVQRGGRVYIGEDGAGDYAVHGAYELYLEHKNAFDLLFDQAGAGED